ncbi:MAG: hydroxyisourate hydrolase [Ornithinimicrobium sp.]
MGTLSTHVLDTSLGLPAQGVPITLHTLAGDSLGAGSTDADGRIGTIGPERLAVGDYRLTFDSGSYFAAAGTTAFYPEITIAFTISDAEAHCHVPVLLNPYGYSTYRGS